MNSQATYETLENQDGDEVFKPVDSEQSSSSTFGATMNFINAIVGAGIVGQLKLFRIVVLNTGPILPT